MKIAIKDGDNEVNPGCDGEGYIDEDIVEDI